ncbi:N-methyltryptophan oxidase, partial [Methylobacterium radiotolerans]
MPLLRRAYENWRELEGRFGEQLLFITGSDRCGPEGSAMVEGSLAACRMHDLPHRLLDGAELR